MMKPYYDHAGVTIYHGDCCAVLPALAGRAPMADLVLTDPPYGVGYVTAWRSHSDPLVAPIAGDLSLNIFRDVLPHLCAMLADDRHAYFFAAPRMLGQVLDEIECFWALKNVLVWDKGNAGSVGDLEAGYGMNWEAIVYASKGRRPLNGKRPRAVIRYDWSGARDPVHPTVKPVPLLERILFHSSAPGELVLDPFMGSGTTLVAAKNLGRRAIGIEVEERYCEAAAKRLGQEVLPFTVNQ